ncbi:ATP-binding protein [Bailinhaonella thermotolerans]|uniref:ATP-binding protein n=1 Tax=Bailinhaonella thermotolerans TaxID=1070861 RepID=A0A3A4B4K4_9ACTN|nr:ATP-binding protein [Bailinhaonella thermotolerans]
MAGELIANAIRYTESGAAGGTVSVRVDAEGERVRVEVLDLGGAVTAPRVGGGVRGGGGRAGAAAGGGAFRALGGRGVRGGLEDVVRGGPLNGDLGACPLWPPG